MDKLNDSADIFANSSTDTVAENMDFSSFIRQGGDLVKINNNNYTSKFATHEYANLNISFGGLVSPLAASSPCSSMNISFVTNQFVSEACNASLQLYCPFCLDEFKLEFLLKEHIKSAHPHELKSVVRAKCGEIEFNACPFCHAKYYARDLLPKHIVRKHQESALAMFPETNPDKFAYCPFCAHKVLLRHAKLLILHIEKKHLTEFQNAVKSRCASVMMNRNDLKTLDYDRRNEGGCSTLSKKMKALTTNTSPENNQALSRKKSILKKTTSYPDGLNESSKTMNDNQHLSTFSLNNSSTMLRRSARRRLRFELPESSSSGSDNKENSTFNQLKRDTFIKKEKKLRWKNIFRLNTKKNKDKEPNKKKVLKSKNKTKFVTYSSETSVTSPKKGDKSNKKVQTTPVYSTVSFNAPGAAIESASSQFKCGLCYEMFTKNAQLLEHIRKSHKGLKLVPQYLCGHCDAKFYRNTFLVRHCWYHHTPHCLKKGTPDT